MQKNYFYFEDYPNHLYLSYDINIKHIYSEIYAFDKIIIIPTGYFQRLQLKQFGNYYIYFFVYLDSRNKKQHFDALNSFL